MKKVHTVKIIHFFFDDTNELTNGTKMNICRWHFKLFFFSKKVLANLPGLFGDLKTLYWINESLKYNFHKSTERHFFLFCKRNIATYLFDLWKVITFQKKNNFGKKSLKYEKLGHCYHPKNILYKRIEQP